MSHSIFCKSNEVSVTPALPQPLLINFLLQEGSCQGCGLAEGVLGPQHPPLLSYSRRSQKEVGGFAASPPPTGMEQPSRLSV